MMRFRRSFNKLSPRAEPNKLSIGFRGLLSSKFDPNGFLSKTTVRQAMTLMETVSDSNARVGKIDNPLGSDRRTIQVRHISVLPPWINFNEILTPNSISIFIVIFDAFELG